MQSRALTFVCAFKILQSTSEFVDYGNVKKTKNSMHRRLGSATLSQLPFIGESNPNFPWEKSQWDNTVVKIKNEIKNKKIIVGANGCFQTKNWMTVP